MKKTTLSLLGAICFILFPAIAQEGAFYVASGEQLNEEAWKAALPENFDLFGSDEPLEIVLESDFKNLNKQKYKDEYQEALLQYQLNEDIVVKRKVRIKARGEFRKRFCYFPPIRLNLKKTTFFIDDLKELEKLKMVTECKRGSLYETYLLKEYLAYKIYNLFSEMSFKVRLLKIKYIDTGRKKVKSWRPMLFL